MSFIPPTVGRSLHYFLANSMPGFAGNGGHIYAAILCGVNASDNINLCVFDHVGKTFPKENVRLVQEGDTTPAGDYALWMTYQTGQAPASQALVARIDSLEHMLRGLESVVASIVALLQKRREPMSLKDVEVGGLSLGLTHPPVGEPQGHMLDKPGEAQTIAASDVGTIESIGLGVGASEPQAGDSKQE